jgi:membrane-associated phospholipid phosphatase
MTALLRKFRRSPRLRRHFSLRLLLRLLLGFGLSSFCLWVFAQIADSVAEQETLTLIDSALADALYTMATPRTTAIYQVISLFGSQIVFLLTLLVAMYYFWRRLWLYLWVWLIALTGGEILNLLLKEFFARARPVFETPLVVELNYSFPSGHAMMSMIAYGMLAYFTVLTVKNLRLRILIGFAATLVVLLIGISRLYLGVHFLSDVVAGFAAGGVWLATCVGLMNFVQSRTASGKARPPFVHPPKR